MGGGSYIPLLGSWMFYQSGAWQAQETGITGLQNLDALRIALCVHESGGKAGSNQDVQLVYDTSSDLSGAVEFGGPADTDKVFRWRDDAGLAEHDTIGSQELSCTTESGLMHEQTCSNSEDVSASAHHEIWCIFEPYNLASETTYYLGLKLEGSVLSKDAEIAAYPDLTSGVIAPLGQPYIARVQGVQGMRTYGGIS